MYEKTKTNKAGNSLKYQIQFLNSNEEKPEDENIQVS